ncbi:MAG: nuclear transport factor 2 family protein [Steroidobacteraceae bacterium]
MAANDRSDPEVVALLKRVEEYRRLYDFKDAKFDRAAVEHLYKKDDDFTAYDIAPPVGGFVGWQRYSVAWYEVMNKYKEVQFQFNDDLRVFRRGDVGWSSVSCNWHGKSIAGAEFRKEIRITLVWVKEGGSGVIAHEHASAPRLTTLSSGEQV